MEQRYFAGQNDSGAMLTSFLLSLSACLGPFYKAVYPIIAGPSRHFAVVFVLLALAGSANHTHGAEGNAKLAGNASVAQGGPPASLHGITLIDHHGRKVAANSFGAGPVLVQFLFTHCPAACPLQTKHLAAVRHALPPDVRSKVQFLSITVDPRQDRPAVLADFARKMGADEPGWRFATGDASMVNRLLQRLNVLDASKPNPQPVDHRLNLYLYDRTGQPVIRYAGNPVDQARLVADLTQLARLGR